MWQHPLIPKPIKIRLLENNSTTRKPQPQTPDTHSEDLYEKYEDAPEIYKLRQKFEPKMTEKHKTNIQINNLHQHIKLTINLTSEVTKNILQCIIWETTPS